MTHPSTIARDSAQHCEAIKYAFRQSKDGMVVSFVLHPSSVPAALQLAPIGARFMLAFVEIGDDETPINRKEANASTVAPKPAPEADNASPVRAPVRLSEKPYDQQAGILCSNMKFRRFLAEHDKAPGILIYDVDMAAQRVRDICDVQSRTEIRPGTRAEQRWLLLVSAFKAWDIAPSVGAA